MKKVLFTGGSGLVGKNVLPIMEKYHNIVAPTRQELDLKDTMAVERYVKSGGFDVVIHSANPNPVKSGAYDSQESMLEDSLRIFMNFYRCRKYFKKLIYLGSGAECAKTAEISNISEDISRRDIPHDIYGFAKYIMNEFALLSDNIYNLRLFACYGPFDHESKFITHCIQCCLKNEEITIRQNCIFDYIHVYDVAKVLLYAIDHDLKEHVYNLGSGQKYSLLEIAQKVRMQMNCTQPITILKDGWNNEYTPNISRLQMETDLVKDFISIDEGIAIQIEYERNQIK